MVSKAKYYELKEAGKCTKCGKDLNGSPSTVRCKECHEKFQQKKAETEKVRAKDGLCIQCGKNSSTGYSNYCNECRQKNADAKRALQNKPLSVFRENNQNCRVCDGPIDSLGVVCHNCLNEKSFTKIDALKRYGTKCAICGATDESYLQIVSQDISVAKKHHGVDLFKIVCFSTNPPADYRVLCDSCYFTEAVTYVQQMYQFLSSKPSTNFDIDSDIIDL